MISSPPVPGSKRLIFVQAKIKMLIQQVESIGSMNVESLGKIPLMPLILLWLAYALLGWYLAAHQIIWLVGAFR